ncbi:hypothetical protein AAFF_G00418980 [Aldrovandia affinis]|uniref:Uncharacterized protein n=1 Tax=Aldrovandia affinis TaxID=143900 RepID=A0AAD7S9V3_9TELE|nr:hypothetical protein AAFF_G00418980 [Aldrovandia affinis]
MGEGPLDPWPQRGSPDRGLFRCCFVFTQPPPGSSESPHSCEVSGSWVVGVERPPSETAEVKVGVEAVEVEVMMMVLVMGSVGRTGVGLDAETFGWASAAAAVLEAEPGASLWGILGAPSVPDIPPGA